MDTQEKDKCIFEAIYREYREEVFRVSMRFSEYNIEISQELTHEVFLKLYDHSNLIDEEYLAQWLYTTTKNMTLNYMKRAKREEASEDLMQDYRTDRSTKSPEDEFFERYIENEREEIARSIMDELHRVNDRWYEAVTKAYCLKMPQKEVAEELGVSITVLHSILHRAKVWMEKRYRHAIDEMEK